MDESFSRLIFLDTETTGFSPRLGDRLIEVAAIAFEQGDSVPAPEGVFHELVDPECDIPARATHVHGKTRKHLLGKPKFAQVAQQLADFVRDAEIVIHNASFDCRFLSAEFELVDMPPIHEIAGKITCSQQLARRMYPREKYDLDSVCERYGIDVGPRRLRHSALTDAQLLAEAYLLMTG